MSDLYELKGFVADKFSVAKIAEFCFERVENIVLVTSVFSNSHNFYTSAKRMFSGVYWNQPVCLSMCPLDTFVCMSVYKILHPVKALAGVSSHIP